MELWPRKHPINNIGCIRVWERVSVANYSNALKHIFVRNWKCANEKGDASPQVAGMTQARLPDMHFTICADIDASCACSTVCIVSSVRSQHTRARNTLAGNKPVPFLSTTIPLSVSHPRAHDSGWLHFRNRMKNACSDLLTCVRIMYT